jgi:outer membrane lipoprotein carrier protein|tara:strand:- start:104 stop:706 length:603 start_codon:yes stop_codon:yes gene_type:complete
MIKYLLLALIVSSINAKELNVFPRLIGKMNSAQGNFSQKVIDKNGTLVQEDSGIFSFKKPNFFRWIYQKPFESQIVSDGELLYLYDPDLKQVVISSLKKLGSVSPAMLLVSGDISNSFELNYLENIESKNWFEAIPKDKSRTTFKSVLINFEAEKINEMRVIDNFDRTTIIVFSSLVVNNKIDDEYFLFNTPENVDVIKN